MLDGTATGFSHETRRVAIVHHHHGVVSFAQVADRSQLRDRPIHAEHAIGCDHAPLRALCVLQMTLQLVHVPIRIPIPLRLAETDAVDDAGVVQLVADDGAIGIQQRLEQAAVGIEARRIQDRILGAKERRDAFLELLVDRLRAANEPYRGHPESIGVQAGFCRRDQVRMIGQPQVVVCAEVEDLLAGLDADLGRLRGGDNALCLVEAGLADGVQLGAKLFDGCFDHGDKGVTRD